MVQVQPEILQVVEEEIILQLLQNHHQNRQEIRGDKIIKTKKGPIKVPLIFLPSPQQAELFFSKSFYCNLKD